MSPPGDTPEGPREAPRLTLIGCGNMGRAMLDGWLAAGVPPAGLTVIDPARPALPPGVRLAAQAPEGPAPDVVVLAVKPQALDSVAPTVQAVLGSGALLLSILAGTPLARLADLFPTGRPMRMMANLAAAFGRSPVAAFAPRAAPTDRALAERVLAPLGPLEWLDREDRFHAITALAGSGPAFIYRFLAALGEGGAALGLEPEASARIALATLEGAAALARASGEDPAALAARVASPGGTTQAGLQVLDAGRAFADLVAATLRAARDRSIELA